MLSSKEAATKYALGKAKSARQWSRLAHEMIQVCTDFKALKKEINLE